MKKPNYLNFGMIWVMAAAVSLVLYFRELNPAHLVRTGLFLAMGVFYFWMNKKSKGK